jgi:deazaflavin-dependent oxidoreductase (nitroreductase family)
MFELPDKRPDGLDSKIVPAIIHAMTRVNIALYRATGGALGGSWRMGAGWKNPVPVCLLTTIGKKSGEPRTAALLYMRDGDRVILVASRGGLPKNPLWYFNLKANPAVTIQIKKHVGKYIARDANEQERAALWPRLVGVYADFDKYAAWTDRTIPVVICQPVD